MGYTLSENLGLRLTNVGSIDGDWAENAEFNNRRLEECFTKPIPHVPEDISGGGIVISVVQSRYVRKAFEITWYFRLSFGGVTNPTYANAAVAIKLPFVSADYASARVRLEGSDVLALVGPGENGMGLMGMVNSGIVGKLLLGSITFTTTVDPHIAL